ncbi:MAG: carbamoyl-phosphate synthase large subunit [Lachnospirales bacterium]
MPKNNDIKKVLVIGSGPIVIGQAAEFDYSGTQCCEALKEEGIEVVLINSNPATIMTDEEVANRTYIEPLTKEFVEKVIEREKPDSVIAGMGGQTGLNLCIQLSDNGVFEKHNVNVIGTSIPSIKLGEDRELFREFMKEINEPVIQSDYVDNLENGLKFANENGYPVIVRPAYTLGGAGGGIADDEESLKEILTSGFILSPVGKVLVEKSIKGWKEVEYEVIRDGAGNCITVCNMENLDPVGIHTGDSIVVAPSQTLSDVEYQMLRTSALKIIDRVGIVGGCNVQFALNPHSLEYAIIEINPRVSRSSALASKVTGYPIAKVSAKIALGLNLDEIKNAVTNKTFACFEPALDYVVVKIPKWPFDKFKEAKRSLGTKMMATGEVMAIGNNLEAALLKAIRSLEIGQFTLRSPKSMKKTLIELKKSVITPDDERLFDLAELIRRGYLLDRINEITGIDMFFLEKINNIVVMEEIISRSNYEEINAINLREWKKKGASDKGIGKLMKVSPRDIYALRKEFNIHPSYKMVDTCAGEFDATSPYYYSTYDEYDEVKISNKKKIIVIGSGPIRIGQGIEFDYCSIHSILELKREGYETIIINNNPETVSTDFDIADKLYFEPLTQEDVLNIVRKEKPEGVILQFGGQTAIKLANFFREKNIKVLGTQPEQIDIAEDREKFDDILEKNNILRPKGLGVWNKEDGIKIAEKVGYPVIVRPSYVLGGQGMEITYDEKTLVEYLEKAFVNDKDNPVLIDKYLNGVEIEVDAICDGESILIPGIMEHLERAGIHSGDSISVYPSKNVPQKVKDEIVVITRKIAKELQVIGMINIQFILFEDEVYVIEVNPRSSRTVPYISKVTGVHIIDVATKVMIGQSIKEQGFTVEIIPEPEFVTAKVPVFSTEKLPDVEVSLGPEMRSTGEVLGIGKTREEALFKGVLASGFTFFKNGAKIVATVRKKDQERFSKLAKRLEKFNVNFYATDGTARVLEKDNVKCEVVSKIGEEGTTILDIIKGGDVKLIIDIPTEPNVLSNDSFRIRRFASEAKLNMLTSLDTFEAIIKIMETNVTIDNCDICSIQDLKFIK